MARQSPRWYRRTVWMIELTTKTSTADRTMGSQRDITETIGTSNERCHAALRPGKSCCRGRCVRTHDWKRDVRRILRRAIDPMRSRSEIGSLCLKDVRHEGLRIAIDKREPCALHLHHHAVSFEKRVVLRVETPRVLSDRVRHDGLGFLEALSE